jgi:multiple sugar transport system substrate-binding protein
MWDASSNNRVFMWGRASIIENGISAIRSMEKNNPELARKVALAPPAAGPGGRLASAHVLQCYVLWKFSTKADLARKFLVDLVAAAETGFRASEFYNMSCFTRAVPDLAKKLVGRPGPRRNPGGDPTADRYTLLAGADRWSACPGHPGYVTAAIDETVQRGVIPAMFARAARGDMSVEASVRAAEVDMRRIFARWTR